MSFAAFYRDEDDQDPLEGLDYFLEEFSPFLLSSHKEYTPGFVNIHNFLNIRS